MLKQKHYPKPPTFILVGLILSFAFSVKLYLWWEASGAWFSLLLAFIFFLIFMLCANPIILWRTFVVDDGFLTVCKRFYKPIIINIADSIFQINIKDNKIHLLFFNLDGKYFHIAPASYTNGGELSERILAYVKKHNITVDIISE